MAQWRTLCLTPAEKSERLWNDAQNLEKEIRKNAKANAVSHCHAGYLGNINE
jgi:hypothetical protein